MKTIRLPLLLSLLIFAASARGQESTDFTFDFSGYVASTQPDRLITGTGTVFDGLKTGMLFQDVLVDSSYKMDVILSAKNTYNGKYDRNGNVSDDIQVNQQGSISTLYNVSLYNGGTTELFNAVENYSFSMAFYDIDGTSYNGIPTETLTLLTDGVTQLTTTTTVNQNGESFSNQPVRNIPNPKEGATDLTAQQENGSVIATFENKNSIDLNYRTSTGGGRNFFVDGNTFTTFDSATAAPGAPAPPALLIGLFAVVLFLKSKLYGSSVKE